MSIRVRDLEEEPGEGVAEEGYRGVNSVWLVSEKSRLRGFSSRIFRIKAGGHTSMHEHEREHFALVLKGFCLLEASSERRLLKEGSLVEIPSWAPHRFSNPGEGGLNLLIMSLTPNHGGSPGTEASGDEGHEGP